MTLKRRHQGMKAMWGAGRSSSMAQVGVYVYCRSVLCERGTRRACSGKSRLWTCILKWSVFTQSCPTLCDPMDYSIPGSSVQGIFQARVLKWVPLSFIKGSSQPRGQTRVSRIAGRRFTIWAIREHIYSQNPWISGYCTGLLQSLIDWPCQLYQMSQLASCERYALAAQFCVKLYVTEEKESKISFPGSFQSK